MYNLVNEGERDMLGKDNIKYNVILYLIMIMFYVNSYYTSFMDYIVRTPMILVVLANSMWLLFNLLYDTKENKS